MSWLWHFLADFTEFRLLIRLLRALGDCTVDEAEASPPLLGYFWYLSQFDHVHHHHGGDLGPSADRHPDQVL